MGAIKPYKKSLLILFSVAIILLFILFFTKRINHRNIKESSIYVAEREPGRFGKSFNMPDKFPNGYPIEILDVKNTVRTNQRHFTGICRWHVKADSVLGGKPAKVPVLLYRLFPAAKRAEIVGETVTRGEDGYFELVAPDSSRNYTLGVRIEKAEGCPEKFKHKKSRQPRGKKNENPV